MLVLWLFYDRYGAPVPTGPDSGQRRFVRPLIGGSLVACLLALSIVGTPDHLTYNAALWRAVDHLRQHGVKPFDIDGWCVWLRTEKPKIRIRAFTIVNLKLQIEMTKGWKPILLHLVREGGFYAYRELSQRH
jgi:hypothetical protein